MKEETDEEEQEKYTFGFSGITMENPYFITLESSIRETPEKDGHTLITEDPKQDPDVQVQLSRLKIRSIRESMQFF